MKAAGAFFGEVRRGRALSILADVPHMVAGSAAGMTALLRRCTIAPFCTAIAPPPRHSLARPFFPLVIPASEPESWAALCVVLRCANRRADVHPRHRLPRPRVGARGDGANAPLYHRALLHCRLHPHGVIRLRANWAGSAILFCHSRLRAGILGGLMRGIMLPLIASPVSIPANTPQGPASSAG